MNDKTTELNLVVYLIGTTPTADKKKIFSLGGHAYTYNRLQEGKKKLAKDVPLSSGYYTGNPHRPNTVVSIEDIVSLTVPYAKSQVEVLITGFHLFVKLANEKDYKNVWLVTPHKGLEPLSKVKLNKEAQWVIGSYTLNEAEAELMAELRKELNTFESKGGKLFFDFTGSAEGGLGNRLAQKQLDTAKVNHSVFGDPQPDLLVQTRKEFENPETDFNKLVCGSRWFFDTHNAEKFYTRNGEYRVYEFGRVERDKNYYGKLTPDVTYSKLYTKEPIQVLDKLYSFMSKHVENNDGYLAAGDLNYVTSKDVSRMLDKAPGIPVRHQVLTPFANPKGDRPVMMELIKPTMMAYRIREFMNSLDVVFGAWQKKDEKNVFGHSTFYDITDLIYSKEANGKGVIKVKLQPTVTPLTLVIKTDVFHRNSIKPVPIMLSLGYDLPDRNSLNSVEDPDVKVWVVADTRNEQGLRYCTVVETNDFVYVNSSAAANLRVLTLGELGRKA